jgi:hypothetical protein
MDELYTVALHEPDWEGKTDKSYYKARQADIDRWNLDRGGVELFTDEGLNSDWYLKENYDPVDSNNEPLSKYTRVIGSAPQEIVVEKDADEVLEENIRCEIHACENEGKLITTERIMSIIKDRRKGEQS